MSLLPQRPPPSPLVGLGVEITASRAKPNLWQAAFRGKAGSPPWSPTSQHRALFHPVLVRPSSDGNNSRLRAISRWSPVSNTGLNLSGHWIPVALVLGSVKQRSGTEEKEGLFCIAWETVLEWEGNSYSRLSWPWQPQIRLRPWLAGLQNQPLFRLVTFTLCHGYSACTCAKLP